MKEVGNTVANSDEKSDASSFSDLTFESGYRYVFMLILMGFFSITFLVIQQW
jgi:hypothetical protein